MSGIKQSTLSPSPDSILSRGVFIHREIWYTVNMVMESVQKLKYGDTAPDFDLEGIDGSRYSLETSTGMEGLLVIFMCNHCPYVQAKMPAIVDLHEKFGERIGFIGINSNDPEYPGEGMENMKSFAAERGIAFAYVLDNTQEVAKAYGATCTPDPFLFDREQKLVFHGRINDAMEPGDEAKEHTMEMKIQQLLAGEEIADEFKPSMGCSIKWLSA